MQVKVSAAVPVDPLLVVTAFNVFPLMVFPSGERLKEPPLKVSVRTPMVPPSSVIEMMQVPPVMLAEPPL